MRKILLLSALAFIAIFGRVGAQTGGPDVYGYTWKDSNAPGGPVYNWVNIVGRMGTVEVTGLTDDNSAGPFSIGWDFHYYWLNKNQVKIGSNGWVAFKTSIGNLAHGAFQNIPTQGGTADDYTAPFVTDLTFETSVPGQPNPGKCYYWTNNADSFVVSYINVPYWQQASPQWIGSNTFQVIFSGVDSSITFQYQSMDAVNAPANANFIDQLIGIENVTGNIGLEHSNDAVPGNTYAVKFYYPANVTFQIVDIAPEWAGNTDNAGQFVLVNQATTLQAGVGNVGNQNTATNVITRAKVTNFQATQVFSDNDTITGGITAGTTNTVSFNAYTFATPGQYTYEVTTVNSADGNPSNNVSRVELSAVEVGPSPDCEINMTYATGQLPDGQIAWAGGNGGAGVKIVPPGFPVTVKSLNAFIFGAIDTMQTTPMPHGFTVELWSMDANGNPDSLLTSETVADVDAVNWAWNNVTLTNPQTISSRGFFVAWMTGGDSTFLGTETLAPISRRTYEILAPGSWATYRSLTTEDFLLGATVSACSLASGVDNNHNANFSLMAFPNPTSGETQIAYETSVSAVATVTVVNMQGQVVFTHSGKEVAGYHRLSFDANSFAPGVYFVNLTQNGRQLTTKLVVNH